MNGLADDSRLDARVAISKLPAANYADAANDAGHVAQALARACNALQWADAERGLLTNVIPQGARVLVKPNFVLHENEGQGGMEPMVTHPSLLRAVVDAALQAGAGAVVVGDAPVQRCDFPELLRVTGLDEWAQRLAAKEARFKGIRDFRRTTCVVNDGVRVADENRLSREQFVLFDLGNRSLLEPVSNSQQGFRVTCYDPRLMAKTHAPGRHQYLVAKDVIEADVIINLPKLKTHKKAGITCALKNLIGINGNKEYLPHHRIGGSQAAGDCYPGADITKRALEYSLDKQNMAASATGSRWWSKVSENLQRVLRLSGDELGVEGSWSGNDTIWRTCLDLNRILLYGRTDGQLGETVQRRVLHIVDGVIAGQGDGPLAPQPLPLGVIFAGRNAAALDWVGAQLLGYDPLRIPVVREAFGAFSWPLARFAADQVQMLGDVESGSAKRARTCLQQPAAIVYPAGWRDAAASVQNHRR
ncbi:MAG: DUF362 domain-containing protein [Acidobacteria bacterium]|nr:DUF362 domain-containing protein [Acidobacteriota bacterium]